ncbi:MAG TPA: metal ABC transporter substrate-binding protein [Solirubrobacteraceae bacterium]|jgi:ABC-type Zn uptake system ZnuABC Zn-binding protein ZnuA|nr:metal ABC transporter substrate-binding protein [Solirubrobacteraceae bacterium]
MPRSLAAVALVLAALLAACGEEDAGSRAAAGLDVVATTTQAADLVRNVGGDRTSVTGLLAANSDPHDYELRPHDVEAVADAGLVVRSGGEVDEWLEDAIDASGTDAPVLDLSAHVHREGDDPHWWQDPRNVLRAVPAIRDALTSADPAGAQAYRSNARAYAARVRRLDAAVARCIDGIPAVRRKLVTSHDALGYYAERYGLEVIGTVIPSLSTEAQPSAGDTVELIEAIRREGVNSVFAESSVTPKVEDAIAREAGARVDGGLWADTLGPPGSSGDTYLGSIASNTRAIVVGLGGRACSLPS